MPSSTQFKSHIEKAKQALGKKNYKAALHFCHLASMLKPADGDIFFIKAQVALAESKHEEAIQHLQKAISSDPSVEDYYYNLGVACFNVGRLDEAMAAFQDVIRFNPAHSMAINNYGSVLYRQERYEEALPFFIRAVELDAKNAYACNNLGMLLNQFGQPEEALPYLEKALSIRHFPEAMAAYGGALQRLNRISEGTDWCKKAIDQKPDYAIGHWNYALGLLSSGRFDEGWKEYEWRKKNPSYLQDLPVVRYPDWQGEDPQGKTLLVFTEQGFGDTFQFVRYLQPLAARGARVLFACPEELHPLLSGVAGIARLINRNAACSINEPVDYHTSLLSLPRFSDQVLPTSDIAVPYIQANPDRQTQLWEQIYPEATRTYKVGLVWAGNPKHSNDRHRSMMLADFAPLSAVPGVTLFSLQKGVQVEQAKLSPSELQVIDLDPVIQDFADTAAIIAGLDLVITVDTSVAHLSGAMAKQVWTLLPRIGTDWRWGIEAETSIWYPSMRLFRQTEAGGWAEVVERVVLELTRLTCQDRPDYTEISMENDKTNGGMPGMINEADRRRSVIQARQTDVERWANSDQLSADWNARAQRAADFIPAGATVLDLGCGKMALEHYLPQGCAYQPVDVVARDSRTQVCNFNDGQMPDAQGVTHITMLGVLEYIYDVPAFLKRLRAYRLPLIMSYCATDFTQGLDRGALGWVNSLSLNELIDHLADAGFTITSADQIDNVQLLMKLSPMILPQAQAKKVLVLSYNNAFNFGDRLGFHLIHDILPPNAIVTHAHFRPWDVPEDDFDLLILGIGNSLFNPILTDNLLHLMDRIPQKVGIFGVQYRENLDRARLDAVLDRLTIWCARYEEDAWLYGRGRSNVVHLGDWLINAFPMATSILPNPVVIDDDMLRKALAMDWLIQDIQKYQTVVSRKLHPLLCAFTSAQKVAYLEQREDGSGTVSGKFRSLLLDVFGRTYPEDQFFEVDREKVAAYKTKVRMMTDELKNSLAIMLGYTHP